MKNVNVEIPDALLNDIRAIADRHGMTAEQFIARAAADQFSRLAGNESMAERAKRSSRDGFQALLDKIPDGPPMPGDELPSNKKGKPRKN